MQGNTRGQSHDIRALALLEGGRILVSGGITSDLCVYPLVNERLRDGAQRTKLRHVTGFPLEEVIAVVERESNELLLLIRKSRVLELWRYPLYGEGE